MENVIGGLGMNCATNRAKLPGVALYRRMSVTTGVINVNMILDSPGVSVTRMSSCPCIKRLLRLCGNEHLKLEAMVNILENHLFGQFVHGLTYQVDVADERGVGIQREGFSSSEEVHDDC